MFLFPEYRAHDRSRSAGQFYVQLTCAQGCLPFDLKCLHAPARILYNIGIRHADNPTIFQRVDHTLDFGFIWGWKSSWGEHLPSAYHDTTARIFATICKSFLSQGIETVLIRIKCASAGREPAFQGIRWRKWRERRAQRPTYISQTSTILYSSLSRYSDRLINDSFLRWF